MREKFGNAIHKYPFRPAMRPSEQQFLVQSVDAVVVIIVVLVVAPILVTFVSKMIIKLRFGSWVVAGSCKVGVFVTSYLVDVVVVVIVVSIECFVATDDVKVDSEKKNQKYS